MSTMVSFSSLSAAGEASRSLPRSPLLRLVETLERWSERHVQRRALQDLSDETLRDIGLSRADIYGEANKPFWRP